MSIIKKLCKQLIVTMLVTLVLKPECNHAKMATGGGLALPEPLVDEEARSWFKRYMVCALANRWNDQKKLLHLLMLLKGCSWAIYDSLRTWIHMNT